MPTSRVAVRSIRQLRVPLTRHARHYATAGQEAGSSNAGSSVSHGVIGGLIGGGIVLAGGYGYYHFSGAKTMVNTAHQTKAYFEKAQHKLSETSPEPNEIIQWLRQTALSCAAFIPGAKGFINAAFDDLEAMHEKHSDKVDKILEQAYDEIKGVTKDKGMSVDTAMQVWEILQKRLKEIGGLAGNVASDILDNHSEIKEKVGGNLDQLKQMGDKYGPEAKKQVDQTWQQIQDIINGGVSMETATKIRSLVEEKTKVVRKLGDEAWKEGIEQAKPYLDKSPKAKELIENNADALKQGDVAELWEKLKDSVQSGDTDAIEQYVKSAVDKAKSKGSSQGGDFDQYLKMIPGADKIVPKLSQLQEIGQKHGKEAESLLKETFDEIQQVLSKRVDQAEKLAQKAKDNAGKDK